jgi:polyhydroxyalkanoate synthesis regulator phasin
MTDEPQNVETGDLQIASRSMTGLLRKVILASIGAASLTREETEAFVRKLIDKGAIVEKDGLQIMQEWRQRRQAASKKKGEDEREIQAILPEEASQAKIVNQNIVSVSFFSNGPIFRVTRRSEVQSPQMDAPVIDIKETPPASE